MIHSYIINYTIHSYAWKMSSSIIFLPSHAEHMKKSMPSPNRGFASDVNLNTNQNPPQTFSNIMSWANSTYWDESSSSNSYRVFAENSSCSRSSYVSKNGGSSSAVSTVNSSKTEICHLHRTNEVLPSSSQWKNTQRHDSTCNKLSPNIGDHGTQKCCDSPMTCGPCTMHIQSTCLHHHNNSCQNGLCIITDSENESGFKRKTLCSSVSNFSCSEKSCNCGNNNAIFVGPNSSEMLKKYSLEHTYHIPSTHGSPGTKILMFKDNKDKKEKIHAPLPQEAHRKVSIFVFLYIS